MVNKKIDVIPEEVKRISGIQETGFLIIIILTVSLFGSVSFAQDVNFHNMIVGNWVQCSNGYSSRFLELNKNGKFQSYFHSCTGFSKNRGVYSMKGDTLHLEYDGSKNSVKYLFKGDEILLYDAKTNSFTNIRPFVLTKEKTYKKAWKNCKGGWL